MNFVFLITYRSVSFKKCYKKTFPEKKRGVEQALVDFEYVGKMEKA